MDARHSTVCKRSVTQLSTMYIVLHILSTRTVWVLRSFCLMPFYLLFQQFLFVQGGSVGEPIFVIVGPIWSHEGILKKYKKKSGLVLIYKLYSFLVKYGQTFFIMWNNSYFLHWNFYWKSCFVVFFLEWNKWKNPQFNFSSKNFSIEPNFFKWDGKKPRYYTYFSIEFGKMFLWKLFIFCLLRLGYVHLHILLSKYFTSYNRSCLYKYTPFWKTFLQSRQHLL